MPGSERGMGETIRGNSEPGAPVPTLRDPTPSSEDRALTERIKQAAELLGIRLLDHIVVGDGTERFFSFLDEGLL